uniref:ankyrin repeat and protein kinase domain-containing protein 1-like isoform X2 n=1 Tax=Myxine glutinosa TaxID=7769 RepID=UPI00358EE117
MAAEDETIEDMNLKLLRENRPDIIDALMYDPSKAFDEAIARGVLSRQNYSDLSSEKSSADKIRKCLDIVDGKGEESAKRFRNILCKLSKSYPRLGPWVKDYLHQVDGRRGEKESVHEEKKNHKDLWNEKQPDKDSNPKNPQAAVPAERLGLQVVTEDDLVDLISIGSGGFGEVFKGKHTKWQNMVAVKKFNADFQKSDIPKEIINQMKAQFVYTVQLLGLYMDSGKISGLVLEWMPHGSVEDFNKKVKAGWALRLRLLHEVALGMNYLHCMQPKHLLHLDLKTANILLNEHLNIKIADFGLCEVHQTTSLIFVEKDVITGTLPYMAPEHFDINEKQSKKWDIYSYAVVIWAVISCSEPYEGVETTRIQMFVKAPHHQRPTMPQDVPDPDLIKLMEQCWDKYPEERPFFDECAMRMEKMQKGKGEIKRDVDNALSVLQQRRPEEVNTPIQEQGSSDVCQQQRRSEEVNTSIQEQGSSDVCQQQRRSEEVNTSIQEQWSSDV